MKVVVTVNKRQIEVQQVTAENEQRIIRQLKQVYNQASKDCAAKIQELSMRTDMENLQTIIYQKQYQEAMKKQIDAVLNELNSKSFTSIADYLGECYETGFIGTLYDLQGQGIPLCFPINQEEVVQALQVDSKISQGLYQRMGEDTEHLKKSIKAELSRGISNGSSWNAIAGKIASGMNSPFTKAYNRAIGIARTEGHRVQQESTLHCQQRAKAKGADVVKQWDSTLDGVTRPTHRELDGQIKEVDEPFEVAGMKAMYPGAFGNPAEDCNCRCCLLQRARWALSTEEFITKFNGNTGELVKIPAKSYDEFRTKAKEVTKSQEISKGHPDCELAKKMGAENYQNFLNTMDENCSEPTVRDFWHKYEEQVKCDFSYNGHEHCDGSSTIHVNIGKDSKGSTWQKPFQITAHESGHAIDRATRNKTSDGLAYSWGFSAKYKNGLFGDTIRSEIDDAVSAIDKKLKSEFKLHKDDYDWLHEHGFIGDWAFSFWKSTGTLPIASGIVKYSKSVAYAEFEKEIRSIPIMGRADISDIVEGATKGKVKGGFGHGNSYWKDSENLSLEAFAEMTDATLTNPEQLLYIKKYLPKSYDVYLEMISELLKG